MEALKVENLGGMTKKDLGKVCKACKIPKYSKETKPKIIEMITNYVTTGGVLPNMASLETTPVLKKKPATPKPEASTKVKAPPKPKVDKLDKKLAKLFDLEEHKEQLLTVNADSLTREFIIKMMTSKIEGLVKSVTYEELRDYVDKFGALVPITYQRTHKKSKLSSKSDEEIYQVLALDLLMENEKSSEALVKVVEKAHVKLLKPPAEKKAGKKGPVKAAVEPSEFEDPSDEEGTYEDSDVDNVDDEKESADVVNEGEDYEDDDE